MEAVEPALNVRGVPARHQAAVLQGPELGSSLGPGRDHLVEGVLQGHRVVVGSLVLSNTSKAGLFPEQKSKGHKPRAPQSAAAPGSPLSSFPLSSVPKIRDPGASPGPTPSWKGEARSPVGAGGEAAHLVPGVGSICRVDEDGDDFGLGQQGRSSPGSNFGVKVVGTFFKVEIGGGVGGDGEELHVPGGRQGAELCGIRPTLQQPGSPSPSAESPAAVRVMGNPHNDAPAPKGPSTPGSAPVAGNHQDLPVNALVVVVSVEELDLLEGL